MHYTSIKVKTDFFMNCFIFMNFISFKNQEMYLQHYVIMNLIYFLETYTEIEI